MNERATRDETAMRLPDFLILGEMKCGTTTLWEMLAQRGGVFFPSEKELHFFGSYGKYGPVGRYAAEGLPAYSEAFVDAPAEALCGEATPNYLSDPNAPGWIREALPDVRLVVILRDPVARAWSHFWHETRRGTETLGFDAALDAEPGRLANGNPDDFVAFNYVQRGRYIENLRGYESAFGREALHVVTLDDLKRSPDEVIAGVSAHLGLESTGEDEPSGGGSPTAPPPQRNRATYPRWARLDRLTRQMKRVAVNIGPVADVPARRLADLTRSWRTYRGSPRMTDGQRARLQEAFKDSDDALAAWLGRPLPWPQAQRQGSTPGRVEPTAGVPAVAGVREEPS